MARRFPVTSVFGRTGAVVAVTNDYPASKVQNSPGVAGATVDAALGFLSRSNGDNRRVWCSDLDPGPGGISPVLMVASKAYWLYVGLFDAFSSVNTLRYTLSVVGVGAQVAELALASTPAAPNGNTQTLTKIFADAVTASLTVGTGLKTQTGIAQSIAAGTHLWVGIRTNMAVTQPQLEARDGRRHDGRILATSGAGVLTGSSSWVGTVGDTTDDDANPTIIVCRD